MDLRPMRDGHTASALARTRSNCGGRRQPSTAMALLQHALQVALPSATRARHQRVVRIAWERMQARTQSRQARAALLAIRCICPGVAVRALDGHVLHPALVSFSVSFVHPPRAHPTAGAPALLVS
jgi:hypothetical protein